MRLGAAVLAGAGAGTLVAALLAVLVGSLAGTAAIVGVASGVAVGAAAYASVRPGEPEARPTAWDRAALGLLAVAGLRQFLWLAYERDGRILSLDAFNYGDLPLHWTYIRFFANGAPFWPENPIFTGARLEYPFGSDLLAAMLVKLGAGIPGVLVATGLCAVALLALGAFRWGRGFTVAAFLFSGGFGAAPQWKNLFLALFVPQRGFLFALPAGLVLLWSWRERFLRSRPALPEWVEGVLWGAMPLFHLHTFLLVSLLYPLWAWPAWRERRSWLPLLWALPPASWGVVEVTDRFRAASLVGWSPGWVIGGESAFVFLTRNFGILLPLGAWLLWLVIRRGSREDRLTVLPGAGLFALLFIVRVAPWAWDNTKLMLWAFVLVLPSLWERVIGRLPPVARAAALALLLGPGAWTMADATFSPRHGYELLQASEVEGVCAALGPLPIAARVATVQTFNHPVALCGHPLVAGYGGHLWSHGIEAAAVEQALRTLMAGGLGWRDAARQAGARYLFWGPREVEAFPGSLRGWESAPLVAEGPWGRLFDLGAPEIRR